MNFMEIANTRQSVRAYDEARPVEREKLDAVLEAARAATDRSYNGPRRIEPADLVLREGDRVLVFSGSNAGGKTVALKTLGLITLMTLAGLPAPVDSGATLPFWNRVHAFIGDEQSLDDHVSTFTGQIHHLSAIWERLDGQSLVLLDEFGAGTDPSQGAALAQAVLDGLLEKGAFTVTATHFPALKSYALTREGVRAASVLFDPNTKKPLFHLAYDQVGASQALDVAREHGLPESVLRRAEHYLLMDGDDASAVMDRLNELARQREEELARMKDEERRLRDKRQALQEKLEAEAYELFKKEEPFKFTPAQIAAYTTVGGAPHLDGAYTIFGEVTEGMNVVELIEGAKTGRADRPVQNIRILKASIVE